MQNIVDDVHWFFATGWDIWSGLFAALPYGDPYIATVVAMMIVHLAYKAFYPGYQTY